MRRMQNPVSSTRSVLATNSMICWLIATGNISSLFFLPSPLISHLASAARICRREDRESNSACTHHAYFDCTVNYHLAARARTASGLAALGSGNIRIQSINSCILYSGTSGRERASAGTGVERQRASARHMVMSGQEWENRTEAPCAGRLCCLAVLSSPLARTSRTCRSPEVSDVRCPSHVPRARA